MGHCIAQTVQVKFTRKSPPQIVLTLAKLASEAYLMSFQIGHENSYLGGRLSEGGTKLDGISFDETFSALLPLLYCAMIMQRVPNIDSYFGSFARAVTVLRMSRGTKSAN